MRQFARARRGTARIATLLGVLVPLGCSVDNSTAPPPPPLPGAARLEFWVQPSVTMSRGPISPAVEVSIMDSAGMQMSSRLDSVTIVLGNNPGGSVLTGTTRVAAIGGVARFSDLRLDKADSGYTLIAISGTLAPDTSNAFSITLPGPSPSFAVQPGNSVVDADLVPTIEVEILDAGGHRVATSSDSVTMAIGYNVNNATLTGTTTVAVENGVATFSNLRMNRDGRGYKLIATSKALNTAVVSNPFDVSPSP